jgi:O-antigen/teichoic acid export membrane protein
MAKSSLSHKTTLVTIANLLKYAVGVILPILLARTLATQEFGTYQQLLLIGSLPLGIGALGLPSSVFYFYQMLPNDGTSRPTLIAQTQLQLLASGMLFGLGILIFAPYLVSRFSNTDLLPLLNMYAVYVGLFLAGEHFLAVTLSQDNYSRAVALEAIETISRVGAVLTAVLLGFGIQGVVFALLCFSILRLCGRSYWLMTGPDSMFKARLDHSFISRQLAFSLPLLGVSCVGIVGAMFDRTMVALNFTKEQLALYSVGALEIPLDSVFQAAVLNVMRATLPALVRDNNMAEIVRIWREAVRRLSVVVLPSFLFLFFHADTFIETLFSSKYAESASVFRIYAFLMPLHMFVLSVVPQAFGKTKISLYVVIAMTASNVALCLLLIGNIGVFGAAIAAVVSQYVGTAIFLAVTTRLLKVSLRDLFPWSGVGRVGLAGLLALIPSALVDSLNIVGVAGLFCTAAAYGTAFLVAALLVDAFTQSDKQLAIALIRKVAPWSR